MSAHTHPESRPGRPGDPETGIRFLFRPTPLILRRMDSRQLALLCRELADHKKAEDIVILDVRKQSSVTDYFVIASGTSEPHLRAIEGEILDSLKQSHDLQPNHAEGTSAGRWIVLDFFDVIVHLMHPEIRRHYDLEGLWSDAARVRPAPARKARAASRRD